MNRPAVRWTRRRIRVPELSLKEETLQDAPRSTSCSPPPKNLLVHTPGDSKQHKSDCFVVLWHDAGPLVEQPELMRLKRFCVSTGEVRLGDARTVLARTPSAMAAVEIIVVETWAGELRA